MTVFLNRLRAALSVSPRGVRPNRSGLTRDPTYAAGNAVRSSAAVVNRTAYFGSGDGSLYELSAAAGVKICALGVVPGAEITSSSAVANGVVYVGASTGQVVAMNTAGCGLLWSDLTGNSVQSSPAVVNSVVYAGSGDGNFYAFSLPAAGGRHRGGAGG